MPTVEFFNSAMTAEQLKAEYRRLVKIWHPDVNKDAKAHEVSQRINAEYAAWIAVTATREVHAEKVKNNPSAANTYNKRYNAEFVEQLEAMVNWLLNNDLYMREGLNVELIGVFVWVSGTMLGTKAAKPIRTLLKQNGYTYMPSKTAWYYTPGSTRGYFVTKTSMDDIRRTYGTEGVYKPDTTQLANTR